MIGWCVPCGEECASVSRTAWCASPQIPGIGLLTDTVGRSSAVGPAPPHPVEVLVLFAVLTTSSRDDRPVGMAPAWETATEAPPAPKRHHHHQKAWLTVSVQTVSAPSAPLLQQAPQVRGPPSSPHAPRETRTTPQTQTVTS